MTALPVTENMSASSSSFEVPSAKDINIPKWGVIDETNGMIIEESLECTAVISPSVTTIVTSLTTSDESDTNNISPEVPQSCLLSLYDGPSNHLVQVNYISSQADSTQEQQQRIHRRCKSTGNLPNISITNDNDDSAHITERPVTTTNQQLKIDATYVKNDNTFTEWIASGSDTYNCDVGSTLQAITTIAFPGSPSGAPTTTKGSDHDDETSSIGSSSSVAYFEPSDFDSTTWRNVVWNHASTTAVGIVTVVALATAAIAHPLFFLAASAIAALGTATAAISQRDTLSSSTDITTIETQQNDMKGKSNEASSTTTGTTTESSWNTLFCFDNPFQSINCDIPNTIEQKETNGPIPHQTNTATVSTQVLAPISGKEPSLIKRRALSNDEQADWLEKYFPPLFHNVVATRNGGNKYPTPSSVSLVGLNAIDCFHVFFDDKAPYNFQALQEKRGDLHIQYGLWHSLPMTGKISMFDHKDSLSFPKDISTRSYQGRLLTFQAKTNSMFGPPYAKTTKAQKFLLVNRRLAILESKTSLSGIPFADRFFVGERWIFISEKVHKQHYVTHVQVSCEVFFPQGSCPFELQIKSKSISTISEVVSSWCTMAVEALKLTEMAKLNRLQRTMEDDPDDDETVDEMQMSENLLSDTNNDSINDDEIEVVADASLLSDKPCLTSTNQRPRSALRGIKHFGRRPHSFDDDCIFAK